MSGWQLITLLSCLANTIALIYWQIANEVRLDVHELQIKDIIRENKRKANVEKE